MVKVALVRKGREIWYTKKREYYKRVEGERGRERERQQRRERRKEGRKEGRKGEKYIQTFIKKRTYVRNSKRCCICRKGNNEGTGKRKYSKSNVFVQFMTESNTKGRGIITILTDSLDGHSGGVEKAGHR